MSQFYRPKVLYLIFFLVVLATNNLHAENEKGNSFLGINLGYVSGLNLSFRYHLSDNWGLQADLGGIPRGVISSCRSFLNSSLGGFLHVYSDPDLRFKFYSGGQLFIEKYDSHGGEGGRLNKDYFLLNVGFGLDFVSDNLLYNISVGETYIAREVLWQNGKKSVSNGGWSPSINLAIYTRLQERK